MISGSLRSGGYLLSSGLASLLIESVPERTVDSSWATLNDLATRAEVHYEYVRFLCKVGFLPYSRGKRRRFLISWVDVENFVETFTFVRPLARFLGVNPTNLAEKLQALG